MKLFTKDIDKKLFAQYDLGANLETQKVIAKIFNPYGRGTWYIINSDPSDPDYLWAIVDLFEVEAGSVSRSELESLKVPPFGLHLERDFGFTPINAAELYKGLLAGKHYKEGGETEQSENKEMILSQAEELEHHVEEFEEAAKKSSHVPAWIVAKVERAATDMSDAAHYLDAQNELKREEVEGEEKYALGGEVKWQEADFGDSALVVSENKMGIIIKPYGRKFHLKFVDGTEKTYDANDLKFFKDIDEFDLGGQTKKYAGGGVSGVSYDEKLDFLKYILTNSSKFNSAIRDFNPQRQQEIKNSIKEANKFLAEEKDNKKKFNEVAIPLYKTLFTISTPTWAKISRKYYLDKNDSPYLMQEEIIKSEGGSTGSDYKYAVYFTRMAYGTRVPVVTSIFKTKEEAEDYTSKSKGYKFQEISKLPTHSEIAIYGDVEKRNFAKNVVHSKEKVDEFFKGKDGFYKKNFQWVMPLGYKWDNWQVVKKADGETNDEDEFKKGGYMADGGKLKNGKYKYEKGDEGMYEGAEVRVVKLHIGLNRYEYNILDEDGNVITHGAAPKEKFERQFAYFPKMAKGGWIKSDKQEDFYLYSTPDKKIKTPFWYSVHEVKDIGNKETLHWAVERGGTNDMGYLRNYARKNFKSKDEALKYAKSWEKEIANKYKWSGSKMAEGGETGSSFSIVYYESIPTRGGERMTRQATRDTGKGSLESMMENAKDKVSKFGYEYADIIDMQKQGIAAKIKKDGSVTKFAEGGDIKKQEWVAVYVNQAKPNERKIIQAFGDTKEEATKNARMSEGYYGIKKPLELTEIYTYSGNLPMLADGGGVSSPNTEFMKWFVDWSKGVNKYVYVSITKPNEFSSPVKDDSGKIVILDVIEKKGDTDAKKYINEMLKKADEFGVSIYLQPIPRTHNLKSQEHKDKITKDYLVKYYQKFGFENTDGGFMVRAPKMASGGSLKKRSERDSIRLSKEYQKVLDSNFDDKVYEKYQKLVEETQIPKQDLQKIEHYVSITPKGNRRDIDIYRYWGVNKMAEGGEVKFKDKVASIKKSLLKRKKVPKAVQKDYGKTFSPAEAEDSAKRIVGAQTARERLMMRIKSKKKK